jgi:hypothetical protein
LQISFSTLVRALAQSKLAAAAGVAASDEQQADENGDETGHGLAPFR